MDLIHESFIKIYYARPSSKDLLLCHQKLYFFLKKIKLIEIKKKGFNMYPKIQHMPFDKSFGLGDVAGAKTL